MATSDAQVSNINTTEQIILTMTKVNGIDPVSVMTALRYSTSLLKVFNNVTFLYDPNWEYEAGSPTYPIAFFNVKSITESMSADLSQKPLLFYNSGNEGDGTKSGVINIITDNIVTKPKMYKMDVLIPANSSTFSNLSYSLDSMTSLLSSGSSDFIAGATEVTKGTYKIVKALLQGLYGSSLSANAICNMLLQQQDYNKASIEYMWRNRRIIALKNWNSWKFKYLAIQNFEVTKIGENGDYYEGTLMLQEVPILTFRNQEKTSLGVMSTVSSFLGKAQKTVAKTFVNAMSASLGE